MGRGDHAAFRPRRSATSRAARPRRRTLITCAWSLQRAHHGEQPYWAAIALAAMLGGIGLPGGGFAFGHGSMNGIGDAAIADVPGPELALPLNPARPASRSRASPTCCCEPGDGLRLQRPAPALSRHQADLLGRRQSVPPSSGSQPAAAGLAEAATPSIVHETWWTPTARHADIVLPATTTLERNDVGGSSRDPFCSPCIRPSSRSAERATTSTFSARWRSASATSRPSPKAATRWAGANGSTIACARAPPTKGVALPGFQQFWAEGFVELPPPDARLRAVRGFPRAIRNAIRSRRRPGESKSRPRRSPSFGYDDCPPHPGLDPAGRMARQRAGANASRSISSPISRPARLHSQMDPGPVSRRRKVAGREPIRINPPDAARRGIRDGDVVRVFNDRGACLAGAVLDDGVMPQSGGDGDRRLARSGRTGEPERHGNPNVLTLDIGTSRLTPGPERPHRAGRDRALGAAGAGSARVHAAESLRLPRA